MTVDSSIEGHSSIDQSVYIRRSKRKILTHQSHLEVVLHYPFTRCVLRDKSTNYNLAEVVHLIKDGGEYVSSHLHGSDTHVKTSIHVPTDTLKELTFSKT